MIPYILTALGGYLIGSSVKQYASGGQIKLLAPNGKPSNLTPEQYKLVRTPEFKAWFGDWENDPENASKVVDDNQEPMVMYHGTQSGYFSEFSKKEIGKNYKELPFGFYFTNIKSPINQLKGYSAIEYAYRNKKRKRKFTGYPSASDVLSYVFEVFLDIKNPIVQDVNSESAAFYTTYPVRPAQAIDWKQKELRIIISKGENDGVISKSGWQKTIEVIAVVLNSNQIKLADGTNTTFDGSNPDIRYAQGGIVLEYLIHWTNRDGLEGIFKDKFLNEETSLTDSLKLPFDKENNMPFGIKLKNVPRKLLVKKGDTLLEKKHEYRTKRKLKIDEYFDGFVVRNNTNKNRLEKYLDNSFAFWDNDILRKYFREHNNDYQIKIKN